MGWSHLVGSLIVAASLLSGCLGAETDPAGSGDHAFSDAGEAATAIEWGDIASAPIRPGSSMNGFCTYNWVFTDAAGTAYIGTAGHCTDTVGELVALGDTDPETDSIGVVVFDSDETMGADTLVDFALIRLNADRVAEAHPAMLGWDGPKGWVAAGEANAGDIVGLHGYGTVLGDREATRDRSGVLLDADEREYRADMPAVPGDSGSPLIHVASGKALGIISRFNTGDIPPTTDIGPTMPFILSELEKAGFMVELATA